MTDSNYTHIVFVGDRSGSMWSIQSDTEGAVNNFIEEQKKVPGRATVTFVQFDDEIETLYEFLDIQDVPEYRLVPRGTTALLDAWGLTVNKTGEALAALPEDERPGQVIFVIATDGLENASTEFTAEKVKQLTEQQTNEYNWRFVFLAANQDAVQVGATYGVQRGSTITYGANTKGTKSVMAATSQLVTQYRGGNLAASYSDDDREEALGTE